MITLLLALSSLSLVSATQIFPPPSTRPGCSLWDNNPSVTATSTSARSGGTYGVTFTASAGTMSGGEKLLGVRFIGGCSFVFAWDPLDSNILNDIGRAPCPASDPLSWTEVDFPTPVTLIPGNTYIVGLFAPPPPAGGILGPRSPTSSLNGDPFAAKSVVCGTGNGVLGSTSALVDVGLGGTRPGSIF